MADCPRCEWRYDQWAAPRCARQAGEPFPVIWDGRHLRRAWGFEPPSGKPMATGWHMCQQHPEAPEVQQLGTLRFEFWPSGRSY